MIAWSVFAGSFIKQRTALEYACRSQMLSVDLSLLEPSSMEQIWYYHSRRFAALLILQSPLEENTELACFYKYILAGNSVFTECKRGISEPTDLCHHSIAVSEGLTPVF